MFPSFSTHNCKRPMHSRWHGMSVSRHQPAPIIHHTECFESILAKRMKEWKYAYVIQCQMQKGFIFFPFTPIRIQIGGAHEIRLSFSFYRNITNVNDCTVTYLTVHLGRAGTSTTDEEKTNFMPSNDKFASWSSEIATHLHHYKFYWSCDDKTKYGCGNDVFVSVLQNTVQDFIRSHQMLFFLYFFSR